MPAARILVVDDDPRITEMLPRILSLHGYDVATAGTVGDAINIITAQKFDVLISDLNMGHAADGFTVVHAMRRVNPDCVNFILTGYPAFESALQALRQQVDDYLTKPSDIPKLVEAIERKLKGRAPTAMRPIQRLSTILRENAQTMTARVLTDMKANPEIASLPLPDEELIHNLDVMFQEFADHLDSGLPNEGSEVLINSARERGRLRAAQHYPLPLVIENFRIIQEVINNVLYENLLTVNLSYLLLDLNKFNDALLYHLKEALTAYLEAERRRK